MVGDCCEHRVFDPLDCYAISVLRDRKTAKRVARNGSAFVVFEAVDREKIAGLLLPFSGG
jgi:hypothetical protein